MSNDTGVKHPEVTVELSGKDGNPYNVLGLTKRALVAAGVSADEVRAFMDDAQSDDYDHLMRTVFSWVTVA